MHILQNDAFASIAADVNVASRNMLFIVDRQQNYLDRMSTVTRQ
jgi:hypothetical protein